MSSSVWAPAPHLPSFPGPALGTSPPLCAPRPLCTAHQLQADLLDYTERQGGPGCTGAELVATAMQSPRAAVASPPPPKYPQAESHFLRFQPSWAELYLSDVSIPFL